MAGNHYVVLNYKLLKACPDPATAVILAELCKWDEFYRKDHANRLGWLPVDFHQEPGGFYKTEDEWEEIGITPRVLRRAKAFLKEKGILIDQMKGSPPKLWFRLNLEALEAFLAQQLQSVRVTNRKGYESSPSTLTNRKGSINKESLKTITIDIPPISPQEEPQSDFKIWWKSWLAAIKTLPTEKPAASGTPDKAERNFNAVRKKFNLEQIQKSTENYLEECRLDRFGNNHCRPNQHAATFLKISNIEHYLAWEAPSRASPSGQEDEWDLIEQQLQGEGQCSQLNYYAN